MSGAGKPAWTFSNIFGKTQSTGKSEILLLQHGCTGLCCPESFGYQHSYDQTKIFHGMYRLKNLSVDQSVLSVAETTARAVI